MKPWGWAAAGALLWASGAQAATVSVAFEGVRSGQGNVLAQLCNDPATFMRSCSTKQGLAKAVAGETVVVFQDVAPGRYALSAFHDENGDFRAEVPPEGYAFGNGAGYPPTFESASFEVAGDVRVTASMTYLGGAAPAVESHGVAAPAGVTRVDVRQDGLYGELYLPASGTKRLPAILVVGGSEGGLDTISGMAADFASKGYAALALAYWRAPGLPQTLELIPLEYFDKAVAWLKARPDVDPGAIGAIGWSRGSEAVLLLAARNPDVHAVVGVAPSGIVWKGLNFANIPASRGAWTAGGQPLAFATPAEALYRPDSPMRGLFVSTMADVDKHPETEIPIEKIDGPVLFLSGSDDHLWPSQLLAERMMARLKARGFRHSYAHLTYAGAGHVVFVGAPDGAMAKAMGEPSPMLGGSAEADATAWADNWPKVLAFYAKALKGGSR